MMAPQRRPTAPRTRVAPAGPLGLVLLALVALAASAVAAAEDDVGARAARLLSEAIRLRTVNPPGNERTLAVLLAERLREAGLETRVVDTPGARRAAVWALLEGAGSAPPIVLLSHLDVVPAEAAEWSEAPFSGRLREGFVFGRGALDAKGVAVVQLVALAELVRRGVRLERDVILLGTPDEETGGRDGAGWLVRERPELLRDAAYLLTEGGGVLVGDGGRPDVWGVAVTEKNPCWMRLVASGTGGHSSVPPADAAVPRLVNALFRLGRLEHPVHVVPEVARMFAQLAPLAPAEDAAGFRELERALAEDPAFRGRFLAERRQQALVRNTLMATVLEGSSRTNVVASEAVAHLDARLLPGESCRLFVDRVRGAIADPGLRVETLLSFPSRNSPIDTPLFRAIETVARRQQPGALVVPRVNAGFTDAHWFRELGIVAYGFVPRWNTSDELAGIHGANERVSVENLRRGVETLIEILVELDR